MARALQFVSVCFLVTLSPSSSSSSLLRGACAKHGAGASSSSLHRQVERSAARADAVVRAAMVARHADADANPDADAKDGGAFVGEFVLHEVYKGAGAVAEAIGVSAGALKNR